jgi:hypothetical protein
MRVSVEWACRPAAPPWVNRPAEARTVFFSPRLSFSTIGIDIGL